MLTSDSVIKVDNLATNSFNKISSLNSNLKHLNTICFWLSVANGSHDGVKYFD